MTRFRLCLESSQCLHIKCRYRRSSSHNHAQNPESNIQYKIEIIEDNPAEMSTQVVSDGWQPVPRSIDAFLAQVDAKNTKPYSVSDIQIPDSEAAKKTMEYAREKLSEPTFHHSMRVFYYGLCTIHTQLILSS